MTGRVAGPARASNQPKASGRNSTF